MLTASAAIVFLSEPLTLGFALGTAAIVSGAVLLRMETGRPATLRAGFVLALASTGAFAARDNLVRLGVHGPTDVSPLVAVTALLAAATATTLVCGVAVHGTALAGSLRRAALPFLPSGLAIGIASFVSRNRSRAPG